MLMKSLQLYLDPVDKSSNISSRLSVSHILELLGLTMMSPMAQWVLKNIYTLTEMFCSSFQHCQTLRITTLLTRTTLTYQLYIVMGLQISTSMVLSFSRVLLAMKTFQRKLLQDSRQQSKNTGTTLKILAYLTTLIVLVYLRLLQYYRVS